MNNSKKVLGIIPARGGSKGVPDKNIRLLNGKPLISYTINAANRSKLLTDFVVSTEDEKVANVCREYGLEIPFMRPKELAEDHVESYPVIVHALKEMEKIRKVTYDYFIMLQPTAPLRTSADIDNALSILIDSNADSVISVTDVGGYHPLRMKRIVGGGILINYIDQGFENMKPRQDLPPVYIRNGAVYASTRMNLIEKNRIVGNHSLAFIMPKNRSINIDTELHFRMAEFILQEKS